MTMNVHRIVTENNSFGVTSIDGVVVRPLHQTVDCLLDLDIAAAAELCRSKGWQFLHLPSA